MPTKPNILKAIVKDEKLMLAYERGILRSAVKYRRTVRRAIEESLSRLMTDRSGRIMPVDINRAILNKTTAELYDLLGNGYEDLIQDIDATFNRRLDTIERLPKEIGLAEVNSTNPLLLGEVQRSIGITLNRIAGGREHVAQELHRLLVDLRRTIGSGKMERATLVNALEKKAGVLARHSATVARTELAGIDRRLRLQQGRLAGINEYKYIGADDSLTRPFCQEHLDMVKPMEYWERISNGQIEPPSIYGGGYNCRHRLIMWKEEFDI